jgi:uncharacterized DUF497 family protein
MIKFVWDEQKSATNLKKHGVSFEEAKTVFYDENAIIIHDPEHSDEEDRFILLGVSFVNRILVVCHCYRENESIVRLISARKATSREKEQYRERKK